MKQILRRAGHVVAAATGDVEKILSELHSEIGRKSQECKLVVDQRDALQRELDAIKALNDLAQKQLATASAPHTELIALMDAKGVSLEMLSEQLSYGKSTLSRFLKGHMKMTAVLAVKLDRSGYGDAKYWMDLQTEMSLREARHQVDADSVYL